MFGGLEQESSGPLTGKFAIQTNGSFTIGEQSTDHRNDPAVLSQGAESFEIWRYRTGKAGRIHGALSHELEPSVWLASDLSPNAC